MFVEQATVLAEFGLAQVQLVRPTVPVSSGIGTHGPEEPVLLKWREDVAVEQGVAVGQLPLSWPLAMVMLSCAASLRPPRLRAGSWVGVVAQPARTNQA
jgi:hypothetical protein